MAMALETLAILLARPIARRLNTVQPVHKPVLIVTVVVEAVIAALPDWFVPLEPQTGFVKAVPVKRFPPKASGFFPTHTLMRQDVLWILRTTGNPPIASGFL